MQNLRFVSRIKGLKLKLFQTYSMSFFCWAQKKIFRRMLVTKQLTVAIDFHSKEKNTTEVNGFRELFKLPTLFKISSFVLNRRKKPTQVWKKWRVNFHFWVNYPFKLSFESDFQCDLRLLGIYVCMYVYVYVYNTSKNVNVLKIHQ